MNKQSNRSLWLMVSGALLGVLLATWLGPKAIVWYFDPPAQFGFNCKAPIEWSLHRFQITQMVGIVVGGLCGLIAGLTVLRRKSVGEPSL